MTPDGMTGRGPQCGIYLFVPGVPRRVRPSFRSRTASTGHVSAVVVSPVHLLCNRPTDARECSVGSLKVSTEPV